jgi:hypothetical protein
MFSEISNLNIPAYDISTMNDCTSVAVRRTKLTVYNKIFNVSHEVLSNVTGTDQNRTNTPEALKPAYIS